MKPSTSGGFSMVELTLALGIIAFALIAIVGLLPVGLTASRSAADDTQTAMVMQDVFNRVRDSVNRGVYFDGTFARVPLSSGPAPAAVPVALPGPWEGGAGNDQTITWYYGLNGIYLPEAMADTPDFSKVQYRVDVKLGRTWDSTTTILPAPDPDFLRPVAVQISSPVNTATGAALNVSNSKTFSFNIRKP